MTFTEIAKRAEKFTIDNSPLILTVIGVTGTITTAILTGKATFRAAEIIADEQYKRNIHTIGGARNAEQLKSKEKINLVWKQYIPPVGIGLLTVAAIVTANEIGTRRAAAVAAAFSMSEKAFAEYKEKVTDKIGEQKEQGIRDDLAQERVNANPMSSREVIISGGGDVTVYEQLTGRYFKSSMEELKKAENDLNYRINHDNYASLSDFYDLLGISHTSISDDVGWNSDKLMDLEISTVLADDGKPCLAIGYRIEPIRNYYRMG